ncbi:hypothetical protein JB92DRAFT_3142146 [Gautieria morchelliformis]|nr:hypothetical protein JB92DRAFT_3142146 [Gautieria morchelliformis]
MIKKARLDFTASWKWEEKDIEQENEWQDQGYSVCAHKPHSAFDQQLDILADKDGNAQETDGEPSRGSGKDSTDIELEGFVFKGCSLREEFKSLIRKSLIRPCLLNGLIKGIPSLFVHGDERKGESIDDGILTPPSRLLSFPDILIHNCIIIHCLQLNRWLLNNRLDPALALPIELIPSPSSLNSPLDTLSPHRTHTQPLIFAQPTRSRSRSSHQSHTQPLIFEQPTRSCSRPIELTPSPSSLNSPLDPLSFFPLKSYPTPHLQTTHPIVKIGF